MLANATVPHLTLSIHLHPYMPELATTPFLVAPVVSVLVYRFSMNGYVSGGKALAACVAVPALLLLFFPPLFQIGNALSAWPKQL